MLGQRVRVLARSWHINRGQRVLRKSQQAQVAMSAHSAPTELMANELIVLLGLLEPMCAQMSVHFAQFEAMTVSVQVCELR